MLDISGLGLDKLKNDMAKDLVGRLQQALFGGPDILNLLVTYVRNTRALLNKMDKEHQKLAKALGSLKNPKPAKTRKPAKKKAKAKTKAKSVVPAESGKRLPRNPKIVESTHNTDKKWAGGPVDPFKVKVTLQTPRRKSSKAA